MEKVIRKARMQFSYTIVAVVILVVGLGWVLLETYNRTEINSAADISEVHKTSEKNTEFAKYIEQEKDFEAHFISLASNIKQQESDRLTQALTITTGLAIIVGIFGSLVAARKLVKPVEEAYRSQERFIQDAAHELRNPLAAMNAAIQQADSKTRNTPLVKTFQRQTNRLIHINEDLLFLERRDSEILRKISLTDLLHDVVEELQPLASSKNIKIRLDAKEPIVKVMGTTDYVRLVKNIIDNAIKYSKNSGVIEISQRRYKGSIELVVTDHGIGIPTKELPRVGSRFYRAKNTGAIVGTGLGLAIVQKILNVYGGSKRIESKLSIGTKVIIVLPA